MFELVHRKHKKGTQPSGATRRTCCCISCALSRREDQSTNYFTRSIAALSPGNLILTLLPLRLYAKLVAGNPFLTYNLVYHYLLIDNSLSVQVPSAIVVHRSGREREPLPPLDSSPRLTVLQNRYFAAQGAGFPTRSRNSPGAIVNFDAQVLFTINY